MIFRIVATATVGLAAGALAALAGCSDSDSAPAGSGAPGRHPDVVLLDAAGELIPVGSSVPYSPRKTCGQCHDVDRIANGFHFQQGRTDGQRRVVTRGNYFGDGREFILSAGMYGKW